MNKDTPRPNDQTDIELLAGYKSFYYPPKLDQIWDHSEAWEKAGASS
jgi:hypothetical protein